MNQTNFGGNVSLDPNTFYQPTNEQEVLDILGRHRGQRIRCVGRMHSWSRVLESEDVLLDLRHLDGVHPASNGNFPCVHVGAGCQIERLLGELERQTEWTLPSVGFITEQTIAGAISTGTHGSGRHSLSHYVTGLKIARYDQATGEPVIVEISDGDELRAARCSLGCLGVIIGVTMHCRPKYLVEEHFREYRDLSQVLAAESDYALQQFYLVPWRWSYFAQHRREFEGEVSRACWLYQWYRFAALDVAMHVLILLVARTLRLHTAVKLLFRWIAPVFVIRNWRAAGRSSSQLVMEHELFRHVEIEIFVQRHLLADSLSFLRTTLEVSASRQQKLDEAFRRQLSEAGIGDEFDRLRGRYCHHYPICIRKILPDDTLISMASNAGINDQEPADSANGLVEGEAWYSITLTNYHRGRDRKRFVDLAEILAKSMSNQFEARLHWGKLCPLPARKLRRLYPAFEEFQAICCQADPDGVFRNDFVQELIRCTTED